MLVRLINGSSRDQCMSLVNNFSSLYTVNVFIHLLSLIRCLCTFLVYLNNNTRIIDFSIGIPIEWAGLLYILI